MRLTESMEPKTLRRAAGVFLVLLGGLMMWLSPEALGGALVMGAGIALELVGLSLERR